MLPGCCHLFSHRHSSTASRIASKRPHVFRAIHRMIIASLPSVLVVMNTLRNSLSIRKSLSLWFCFRCDDALLWAVVGRDTSPPAAGEFRGPMGTARLRLENGG